MNEATILLVQPNPALARQQARVLLQPGVQLVGASSGEEALLRFRRKAPDLVVLDSQLPDLDGFSVCARMRLDALEGDMPILVTSWRPRGAERAVAAGADAVLKHPVEAADLVALVRELLAKGAKATGGFAGATLEPMPPLGGMVKQREGAQSWKPFRAEALPRLLLDLHQQRYCGQLEIEARDLRSRIHFSRGHPTGVRLRSPDTWLGNLLVSAGHLTRERISHATSLAIRRGVPLGRLLVAHRLLDPISLDRVLQIQTIRRVASLRRLPPGRYRLAQEGLCTEEAGFPTHIAAVLWHMADENVPVPPFSEAAKQQYVHTQPDFGHVWNFLDPKGQAAGLRLVLLGGGRVADALALVGERVLPLLALLRHTGVMTLSETPVDAARRASLLVRTNLEPYRERLEADHAIACGADCYTVLGISAAAGPEEIEAAAAELMDLYRPETLPPGLSQHERAQAAEVHRQVLAATRMLIHPRRRAVHDHLLAGKESSTRVPLEVPDHAIFQTEHARRLYRHGQYLGAAAMLRIALLLEGDDSDILTMLGRSRQRAAPSDPYAGEPQLRRALALDPQNSVAAFYLGKMLLDRGERSQGRTWLRRSLALDQENQAAREILHRGGASAAS